MILTIAATLPFARNINTHRTMEIIDAHIVTGTGSKAASMAWPPEHTTRM
ncbi:MAG: hypothetical protein Q7J51_05375 [Sheuella sp.]|nr:hypothetical protein [Sheuella sp.]